MESQSTALGTGDLTDGEIRDSQYTCTRRTLQPRASGRGRPVSNSHVIRNDRDDNEIRHITCVLVWELTTDCVVLSYR